MKIGIAAEGPGMDAAVGHRFGTSPYFLVIDLDSNDCNPMRVPDPQGGKGSGMRVVTLALEQGVQVVLTGYCSPVAEKYLSASGIIVVAGIQGVVGQVVTDFKGGAYQHLFTENALMKEEHAVLDRDTLVHAVKQSSHQLIGLLPILFGVILLTGLLNTFVSKEIIASIFTGRCAWDAALGAAAGSVFAGNPINSYVIAGEFLANGISLYAVTAFIVSWVSVGLVQLPAEMASLGRTSALARNGIAFVAAIIIALATPILLTVIS